MNERENERENEHGTDFGNLLQSPPMVNNTETKQNLSSQGIDYISTLFCSQCQLLGSISFHGNMYCYSCYRKPLVTKLENINGHQYEGANYSIQTSTNHHQNVCSECRLSPKISVNFYGKIYCYVCYEKPIQTKVENCNGLQS